MRRNLRNLSSESLLSMCYDQNPIVVCEAICEIIRRNSKSIEEHDALISLCDNKTVFWNNYLVSDFAEAALDILELKKYSGERYEVRRLISSKLIFD